MIVCRWSIDRVDHGFFSNSVVSLEKAAVMQASATEFDFIEEIRLRRWARENYVAAKGRNETWHPVILDEMRMKDREMNVDEGFVIHNDCT
jgi:hypothetical protein